MLAVLQLTHPLLLLSHRCAAEVRRSPGLSSALPSMLRSSWVAFTTGSLLLRVSTHTRTHTYTGASASVPNTPQARCLIGSSAAALHVVSECERVKGVREEERLQVHLLSFFGWISLPAVSPPHPGLSNISPPAAPAKLLLPALTQYTDSYSVR